MPLDKRPDAVIYPIGYFPGGVAGGQAANKVFGPILRCNRVAVGDQTNFNFARPYPARSRPGLLFPEGHPLAKQDRYAWFEAHRDAEGDWFLGDERTGGHGDRATGMVLFGYLLPDEFADDEAVLTAVAGSQAAAAEQYRKSLETLPKEDRIARVERLRQIGIVDDDEADKQIRRIKAAPKPKVEGEDEPEVTLIEDNPKGEATDE